MKINKLLNSKKIFPILSGIEIGIPINIISKVSNDVNFVNSPLTKESIFLNCLLGFCTYKQDRYLDSLEYCNNSNNSSNSNNSNNINNINNSNFINNLNLTNYSLILNKKHYYYISILDNEKYVQFTLFCSYISICIFAVYYHIGLILPLFTSTFTYKYLKQNKYVSYLKPFYVAFMWTFCTMAIPLIINHDYNNILQDTSFNLFNAITPTFLNLFALTNLADLKDYDEDLLNEVNTLPIILGVNKTKVIIILTSLLSTLMFINSPYYINNLQNMFYISSNTFPYISLFNFTI